MKYDFDSAVPRFGTGSIKYEGEYKGALLADDVLPMWIADMDFACPPQIVSAVKSAADNAIYGYTSLNYMPFYWRAVCDYYRRRYNWYINSRDVLITPGVVPGIDLVIQALTRPGDGIIIQRPVYYPFAATIEKENRRVINNPLILKDGRYTMDFDDLRVKAASRSNRMLILCSPHNPVGRVWTKEELTELHDICVENDVIIVSDEIHCDLTRTGVTHTVLASLFPEDKSIITCTAPSKTFNIAGLARSHIVMPDKAMRDKVAKLTTTDTNPITAFTVAAAFNECEDWLAEAKEYLDGNFEYLRMQLRLKLPKARLTDAEATYLAWVDVSAYTTATEKLVDELLRREAAYVEPGDMFGKEGAGFLRVNVGCPRRFITRFVDALAGVLDVLSCGDPMPAFALNCAWSGGKYSVAADGKKKIIVFLRGVGCPFTQLYLARLAAADPLFREQGVKLIAVTQDTAASQENRLNRAAVPFYLLADPEAEAFSAYKVGRAVSRERLLTDDELDDLKLIRDSGLQEGLVEGDQLVLPAAFGIDTTNRVAFAKRAVSVGDLPSPRELLAAFNNGGANL